MPRTITVNQKHIDTGVRYNCSQCPIALAIKEALPNEKFVEVYCWTAKVGRKSLGLPFAASEFIKHFDHNPDKAIRPVAPVSFELDI